MLVFRRVHIVAERVGRPEQRRRDQQRAVAASWGKRGTPGLQRGRARRLSSLPYS